METSKLIKSKVTYINSASNDMIGCATWRKLKSLIKMDIKEKMRLGTGSHETSFNQFQTDYGLKKEYSDAMLLEINADLFKK